MDTFLISLGSDKSEFFEIERLNNGDSKVRVYKLNKEGEKKDKLYSRTFSKEETKEIRLYGLSGNDQFKFFGNSKSAIKTRVVGGEGETIRAERRSGLSSGRILRMSSLWPTAS